MYSFFLSQSKFNHSIWVHQTAFDGCNFGRLYLLHPMFIFNKICRFMFPLKSSYCNKKFNVNPSCFECLGAIQSSNSWHFWITMNFGSLFLLHTLIPFLMNFFGKVAYTSLVCVAKISYQSESHEWLRDILVEGGSALNVFFCNFSFYFLTFESHFTKAMSQLNDYFFTSVFVCWFWITL